MRHPLGLAAATASLFALAFSAHAQEIVVGGKNFTEQLLLAEMTAQLLEDRGYDVDKNDGLGSTVLRQAQENGQIDVYWEYTGTSLVTYNKVEENLGPQETIERVRELDSEKGLTWLECSDANNTYALAVAQDDETTDDIMSLSDLAAAFNDDRDLDIAVNAEFPRRPDGLPGLEEAYDFDVGRRNLRSMESGLTYQALQQDQVDVALVFATDGRIAAFNFRVLEDDQGFFPNYAICPVVRTEVLEANPDLAEPLEALSATLSDDVMQELNARVDVEKETVEAVATSYLQNEGLI